MSKFLYPQWVKWRLGVALRGSSLTAKGKLLFCATLKSIPQYIGIKLPQQVGDGIERIADKLAVNTVVRVGTVKYVLVDSESLDIISPLFEAWSPLFLRVREGEVFLDVGSHIGKYSLLIARTVKNSLVISVEPNPINYQALKRGIELNGLSNVIPINLAAWKEKCQKRLFITKKAGGHTLKLRDEILRCYSGINIFVDAESLDNVLQNFSISKVDWVKIDVEGVELEVLQGLKEILQQHPKLIVESNNPDTSDFLRQFGYVGSVLDKNNFLFW